MLKFAEKEARLEKRQMHCDHVWHHEHIIQPGGRGYSSSWCRKCKIDAWVYERDRTSLATPLGN